MELDDTELQLLELLVRGGRPHTIALTLGVSSRAVASMILDLAHKVEPLSLGQAMESFRRERDGK